MGQSDKPAPELIAGPADHAKLNMDLTAWKGKSGAKGRSGGGQELLDPEETSELNRIVSRWLDLTVDQTRRRKQVSTRDWETKLNEFLRFNLQIVITKKRLRGNTVHLRTLMCSE